MGNSEISFDIVQSKCSNLGNQFWEISFLRNQLTDDSALKVFIIIFCMDNIGHSVLTTKYKDEWTLVDWLDNHKGGEMDTKEVIDLQMLQ